MVEALTDDQANEARGDAATTNLVLVLAASVHRAVTAAQPSSRADGRSVHTPRRAAMSTSAPQRKKLLRNSLILFVLSGPSIKVWTAG